MALKPRRLKKGSLIGIAAPSGPAYDIGAIYKGIGMLTGMGFNVAVGQAVFSSTGYLAGSDDERAEDINSFFDRQDIDGIICLRGGYGSQRILDKIDYNVIKKNPKVFVGYSDITAIHSAISKYCHMVTFHGPMVYPDFGNDMDDYTKMSFLKNVACAKSIGVLENPWQYGKYKVLSSGYARGEITGGNLSLVVSSIGTPYETDMKGKVLFLEEIGEEPYRIDRMLTQLILHGGIKECAAILLGQWTDCKPGKPDRSFSVEGVLMDRLLPLNIPILYNLAAGHERTKMTLPLGVKATITEDGTIIIDESAVV